MTSLLSGLSLEPKRVTIVDLDSRHPVAILLASLLLDHKFGDSHGVLPFLVSFIRGESVYCELGTVIGHREVVFGDLNRL